MKEIEASKTEDFVSLKFMELFIALTFSTNFLSLPRSLWRLNNDYFAGKNQHRCECLTTQLRVVALIKEYIYVLTTNEEQRQHLLKVVADHRKNFPESAKRDDIFGLQKTGLWNIRVVGSIIANNINGFRHHRR